MPTLRLKLIACAISGALMCAAGAPFADVPAVRRSRPRRSTSTTRSRALAMSLIGGTAHWIGPVLGAILLGTMQQLADGDDLLRDQRARRSACMLVLFVVGAPDGILGLCASRPVQGQACGSSGGPAMSEPLLAGRQRVQALRRLHRARRRQRRDPPRRALRPDRPQRLGQDDADQLHLRRAAQRQRHDRVRRRGDLAAAGLPAHAARHRAQLPDPAAVHEHDGAGEPAGAARVRRPRPAAAAQATDEAMAILDKMGLAAKADTLSSQLSQVELRKLELARAMAARPKLLISDEAMAGLSSSRDRRGPGDAVQAQRARASRSS